MLLQEIKQLKEIIMSNFIRYKKCEPVNLDLTFSIENKETHIKPALIIRFNILLDADACLYWVDWEFDSEEERNAVHAAIIKREVEEIKI